MSQAAAVRTVCTQAQKFESDTLTVSVPLLHDYIRWIYNNTDPRQYIDQSLTKLLWGASKDTLTNSNAFTTVWIPVPNATTITTGLIILGPSLSQTPAVRQGLACSVDAKWLRIAHTMSESLTTITSEDWGNPVSVNVTGKRYDRGPAQSILPVNDGNWKHVAADSAWLDAMNPSIAVDLSTFSISNMSDLTTALGNVIMAAASVNLSDVVDIAKNEQIVSVVFADGLSRVGLNDVIEHGGQTLDTSNRSKCEEVDHTNHYVFCPKPTNTDRYTEMALQGYLTGKLPPIFTTTKMKMTTKQNPGYGFHASRAIDYLAITVLIIYMLVALTHIAHLLVFRRSSECWDTLEEFMVLAQTSVAHTQDLDNTCAGIKRFRTMGLNSRIRRTTNSTKEGHEELQLLIDRTGLDAGTGEVKPGEEYGSA